jgi:hypothetical protein
MSDKKIFPNKRCRVTIKDVAWATVSCVLSETTRNRIMEALGHVGTIMQVFTSTAWAVNALNHGKRLWMNLVVSPRVPFHAPSIKISPLLAWRVLFIIVPGIQLVELKSMWKVKF